MGVSAVETANMEGGRCLILALVGITLLSSAYANPREVREADDEAITTVVSPTTTTESVVEKTIESDSSDNEIDDATEVEEHHENMEHEEHDNYNNCHKASFKYRKDLFCDKCIKKGLVKLETDVGKKLHCKKCRKSKFRFKNGDFCKMKCPDQMKEEVVEVETETTTMVVEEASQDEYKLGPLGSLLKFFVVTNTWGTAEKATMVEEVDEVEKVEEVEE